MYAIAIHGGAGQLSADSYSEQEIKEFKEALKEALTFGIVKLKENFTAREAVLDAVKYLEDCPLFNAGRGSVLNCQGEVEMDASFMCGLSLQAGGVSAMKATRNPIFAANLVALNTPHRLLAGKNAEEFLIEQGLEVENKDYFITQKRKEQFERFLVDRKMCLEHDSRFSTVGAVALDSFGSLASATSTGGIIGKMPGRVADSAIIGAGTYADNRSCAVSCTGMGDEFIRNCVAYQIHARMLWLKESLTQASRHALASIAANGAHGGLISLNTLGHCVMEFGTTAMFRAYANEENVFHVGIFREDCPTVI